MTLSRRDFLKLSGAAMLSAAAPFARPLGSALALPDVIYHGSRLLPRIAMTYDDCWHPDVLDQLASMVQPYPGFRLTFFAVGDAIDINEALKPGLWKRLLAQGHEIGYHTYHHVTYPATADMLADFDQWMTTVQRVLGFAPRVRFARAPGNDLTPSFLGLCQQRGLVATQFSTGLEASNMDDSMLLASKVINGDIVQMHTYQDPPNHRFDVDISARAIPYLAGKGFALVTLSQLYDDMLRELLSSDGCDVGAGSALTRVCLE